ncbi:M3 family metallopeptidase [Corynebacterium callunae]|uniref:M3 family metallopeptidase n=1 Tax=Corynebacterium callunae TaxID=1721 RepID=UPI001FFFB921|nr:M3 family metallopeptidase [Corynebacterium callunae]MCK2199308.1 M3 family metallopeptidase [Corynebacterium callunae]
MTVDHLLKPSNLPYQLPDFANISTADFLPAFEIALAEHDAEIAGIAANPEPVTWENTIEALERAGQALNRVAAVFFNLQGTDSSPEMDEIAQEIAPKLSAHSDAIFHNAELFARVEAVSAPEDEESQRLLAHTKRAFRRRGAALNAAGKAQLSEINQRLSALSEEFGRNLLKDTRELAVSFSEEELAGFSPARISAAADYARETGVAGYVVPLELPTVQAEQAVLSSPESRAKLYEASQKRGALSNKDVLLETVRLRAERAALLGYDTHADYVIEEETADDVAAVRALLYDLAPAASANAKAEYKLSAEEAESHGQKVDAADWSFWETKVRERDYALDEAQLRQYFPLDQVLEDGVFFAANRLYGITVEARPDLRGYAEGVDVWEVKDSDGSGIGLILTDYYGRPSKRGGAWMSSFVDQSELLGTKPVVVNVMGINKPTSGQALLSLDEVTTIFHEFGHGLHGLLSQVRYPSFSGTSVPRDYVEFPSQINENWAFDPAVVRNYARHVDTGAVIPDSMLQAIEAAKQFGQGFATAEYLAASIIDLAWHSLSASEAAAVNDIEQFEADALAAAGLDVEKVAPRYRSTYFNHIFAGGYSAGYYSYLWAEALDADGFDWFVETGAAGTAESAEAARQAGARFRELVLSKGASTDYSVAFENLRGRNKDLGPLLRRRGLAGAI